MAKNIMLSFLSPLPGNKVKDYEELAATYILESGCSVEACQTNEAPIYDVYDELQAKGEKLDALFTFSTAIVNAPFSVKYNGQVNKYSGILSFLKERCHVRGIDFEYQHTLAYNADAVNPVDESRKQAANMAVAIKKYLGDKTNWWNAYLYVDITGGFRYANMIMMTVVRLLQYEGLQVKKIIYSDKQGKKGHVYDFRELNKLYSLTSGADAFVKYGRSQAIEEYFGYIYGEQSANSHLTDELVCLLQAMHEFSDSISLCRASTMLRDMQELRRALDRYAQHEHPASESAFAQMLDTIYREYDKILVGPDETYVSKMLDVIEWCMQKGFMQQALTFSNEWLPIYIVRMNICYPMDENFKKTTNALHRHWEQEFIINYTPPKDSEMKMLGEIIKMMSGGERINCDNYPLPTKFKKFLQILDRMERMRRKYELDRTAGKNGLRSYLATDSEVAGVLQMLYQKRESTSKKSYTDFIYTYGYKANVLRRVHALGKNVWYELFADNAGKAQINSPKGNKNSWMYKEQQWRNMFATNIAASKVDVEDAICLLHHHYVLQQLRHSTNHANQDTYYSVADIKGALLAAVQDFCSVTRKIRRETL